MSFFFFSRACISSILRSNALFFSTGQHWRLLLILHLIFLACFHHFFFFVNPTPGNPTSSAVFICFGCFLLGNGNWDPEFGGAHKGRIWHKGRFEGMGHFWIASLLFLLFFSADMSSLGIGLAELFMVTLHYAGQLWTCQDQGELREVTHGARGAGGAFTG